jgi:hypothetical protein
MDWLQFSASIIGSLAWPLVVIVLLLLLRTRIGGLADRLQEISLPAGANAKFEKALGEAKERSQQVDPAVREAQLQRPLAEAHDPFVQLANHFPEAAIMQCFRELEKKLGEMVGLLDLPTNRRDPTSVIEELRFEGYIDHNTQSLFEELRLARNIAAHATGPNRVSPGAALEFRAQTLTLFDVLEKVLAKLRANPPIKDQ